MKVLKKDIMEADPKDEDHKDEDRHLSGECMNKLIASILAYGVPAIRQLARKKTASLGDDPDAITRTLELPIALPDLIQVISDNAPTLRKAMGDQSFRVYLSSVELLEKELDRSEGRNVQLVVCDDEHSDKELVYQIAVDTDRRHISVAFRGSATFFDLLTDVDPFISSVPNPVASEPGQAKTIGIHHGFYSKCTLYFE